MLIALVALWWLALAKKPYAPSSTQTALQAQRPASAVGTTPNDRLPLSALPPAAIERSILLPAARDPFSAYQVAAAPIAQPKTQKPKATLPAPAPVAMLPAPPQAAPAPTPPAMNLRYVGQMTAPDGNRQIYAAAGDEIVMLVQGQTLTNGYQVTRIESRQVILTYPALQYSTQLLIPEPPRYEIR
jgi:hypothetical protein